MELRDVYLRDGTPAGRCASSKKELSPDEFFLHAHLLHRNSDGLYLLQRRALDAHYFSGQWDVTGGGVRAGETSRDAAIRETREELGFSVPPSAMRYVGRQVLEQYGRLITHVWCATVDARIEDLVLDPVEVCDAKYVPFDAFVRAVMYNKDEAYLALLQRAERLLTQTD